MAESVQNNDTTLIPLTNHLIQFIPSSQLPLKLIGSHNFVTWKAQLELLLHGHDLYGFLDGTKAAPSEKITDNEKLIENPKYRIWFRQDKLIHNAILTSVDPTLAPLVVTAKS